MRRYKKISKCPPKLQEYISWANRLPSEAEVENAIENLNTMLELEANEELPPGKLERIFKQAIDDDEDIFQYMTSGKEFEIGAVYEKFLDVVLAERLCRATGRWNKEAIENPDFYKERRNAYIFTGPESSELFRSFTFRTDINGNIRPRVSEFAQIFIDYEVPFARIRICPVCDAIYWAKRLDAKTCGEKQCAETLSKRTARAKKMTQCYT